MSRVGNNPITIPEGVSVEISENKIIVKGKLGEIEQEFSDVTVKMNDGTLNIERVSEAKDHKSKHGLYRALINNMVIGVSEGWTKELELVGVGYRASAQGQKLELALGFSHSVVMNLANEVKVETVSEKGSNPIIKLTSFDKQLVGQVAAKIRSFRKPEPYKGKGIRFVGEQIRRKARNNSLSAGLKGKELDGFGIHKTQPLVLVNYGGAKGEDIYKLSLSIKEIIFKIFKIELETEVNII